MNEMTPAAASVYATGDLTSSCGVNPGRILAQTATMP